MNHLREMDTWLRAAGVGIGCCVIIMLMALATEAWGEPVTDANVDEVAAMCSATMQVVSIGTREMGKDDAADLILAHALWYNDWTTEVLVTAQVEEVSAALLLDWVRIWPILMESTGICILMKTEIIANLENDSAGIPNADESD